ncbi:hypothetical protein Tco_0857816 [Tanacetum coccineum]|uniref:Uncharacterized protein n=1 Tax=Tanacetum coccineum TaxID=301880 RepID=A0ABQ4YX27_9ASTR
MCRAFESFLAKRYLDGRLRSVNWDLKTNPEKPSRKSLVLVSCLSFEHLVLDGQNGEWSFEVASFYDGQPSFLGTQCTGLTQGLFVSEGKSISGSRSFSTSFLITCGFLGFPSLTLHSFPSDGRWQLVRHLPKMRIPYVGLAVPEFTSGAFFPSRRSSFLLDGNGIDDLGLEVTTGATLGLGFGLRELNLITTEVGRLSVLFRFLAGGIVALSPRRLD